MRDITRVYEHVFHTDDSGFIPGIANRSLNTRIIAGHEVRSKPWVPPDVTQIALSPNNMCPVGQSFKLFVLSFILVTSLLLFIYLVWFYGHI